MSTTDQTARVQVTLSTATDVVSFPYKFLESNDLVVTSDGRGALVLDTDYSVTGAGETAGGNVTMIGGTIAERITVTRSTDNSQELSIATNGPLSSSGLEAALDKLTKITQDQGEEISRALTFPHSEVNGFSATIADATTRANKVLSFDGTGALNVTDDSPSSAVNAAASAALALTAASNDGVVSIAALKAIDASALPDNYAVQLLGYYAEGDGGGGTFYWDAASTATDNGGTIIIPTAAGTGRWMRVYSGAVNPRWFGVRGDGTTDDTALIQAAVDATKDIFFTAGTYRQVGTVTLPAETRISGTLDAEILCDPAAEYLSAYDASAGGCEFIGLRFVGNGVTTAATLYMGSAISGNGCDKCLITECSFESFVHDNVDDGIIGFQNSTRITVESNSFEASNDSGKDVNLENSVGDSIIQNNISYSNSDSFAYISSVGGAAVIGEIATTSHHVINGNIYIKNKGNTTTRRHGIVVHYNGGTSHATINGNILVNGTRHGIYLRGSNTIGAASTGPDLVTGNIVRYFGGEENQTNFWGYNSGIKVESMNGCTVSANLIENSGYNTDGTTRTYQAAGIECIRAVRDLIVIGNQIRNINGIGVSLATSVSLDVSSPAEYGVENVQINSNSLVDCVGSCINVNSRGTGETGTITVSNNTIRIGNGGLSGMTLQANRALNVSNNDILGTGSANLEYGIVYDLDGSNADYSILSNSLSELQYGISRRSININGTFSIGYSGHRDVGLRRLINFNRFINCDTCYLIQHTTNDTLSLVGSSNSYENCTTTVKRSHNSSSNGVFTGDPIGTDASGNTIFKIVSDNLPSDLTFYVGDEVIDTGVHYICVTSNATGGVWKKDSTGTHEVIAAGIHDWAGGAATTDSISITGLLSTDIVVCTLVARAGAEVLELAVNDDGNDQIDLTLSANGTNGTTKISYQVLRSL